MARTQLLESLLDRRGPGRWSAERGSWSTVMHNIFPLMWFSYRGLMGTMMQETNSVCYQNCVWPIAVQLINCIVHHYSKNRDKTIYWTELKHFSTEGPLPLDGMLCTTVRRCNIILTLPTKLIYPQCKVHNGPDVFAQSENTNSKHYRPIHGYISCTLLPAACNI